MATSTFEAIPSQGFTNVARYRGEIVDVKMVHEVHFVVTKDLIREMTEVS